LAGLIGAHCPFDGPFSLGVPGVHATRFSRPFSEPVYSAQRPVLCIVAQGVKRLILGPEIYTYDSSSMLIVSVDLPAASQVMQASPAEPYLGLIFGLDPLRVAELTLKVYPQGLPRAATAGRGVFVSPLDPHILDAAIRLIELGTQPQDVALLAPLVVDEILIRLLRSPLGMRLAQIGLTESSTHKVATAIAWLRAHYAQPMRTEELAALVHMSVSAFHRYFRAVTSMSPLQFQKALRLQEARRLMLSSMTDAASAGRQVGYLSASQFGREYARFFGQTPARDVARLLARNPIGVGAAA
jgi:AraC-like DNA-binding protein